MKKLKFDSYDGVCFLNGLVFFAPVALLVRTQAGVSEHIFFLLQALLSGVIFLGEIPTGFITDKIGYRKSLIWAQVLLFGARSLLLAAFVSRSLALFVVEAVVEGIAACFTSGTGSAYLYALYGENGYLAKTAHAGNFGTAGFIISTVAYAGIYKISGMEGLLITTVVTNIIAVVCSFFLRSESSKTVIADRKEVQILAVFKNKKAFLCIFFQPAGMLSCENRSSSQERNCHERKPSGTAAPPAHPPPISGKSHTNPHHCRWLF